MFNEERWNRHLSSSLSFSLKLQCWSTFSVRFMCHRLLASHRQGDSITLCDLIIRKFIVLMNRLNESYMLLEIVIMIFQVTIQSYDIMSMDKLLFIFTNYNDNALQHD